MPSIISFIIIIFISLQSWAISQVVVIGDTGKDNKGQKAVAEALFRHCSKSFCDHGILTGDNIYEAGMTSPSDPVLDRMFKKHYEKLEFPFFVALGNHDYGQLSNDWIRGTWQLGYSQKNPQYYLPNYFYYQAFEDYVLVVLDTTRLMWAVDIQAQKKLIQEAVLQAQGKWLIVAGHHPYLSNGKHGNAGRYERVSFPSFVAGTEVKKFIDENICGTAHVYLSGHDHNLQLTDGRIKNCPTLFAVSGAGASTEELSKRNKTIFQSENLGFLSIRITSASLNLDFLDANNKILHQTELKK